MSKSSSIIIGLYNPKSPTNVGSVMRAVGCFGANSVSYTGQRFERAAKYQTDTKNVNNTTQLKQVDDLATGLPGGMKVVCVELVEGATSLLDFEHPQQAIYVFGPEDGSLPQALIDRADHVVYVPTIGCLNLAATVNVLLYDRLSKAEINIDHEQRIKNSRDVNNRLRL